MRRARRRSISELVKLKFSGANIFVNFVSAKFAQAIKKAAEIGWKPVHILHGNSQSISTVLKPAGLENAKDIITASYSKDPADAAWKDDPGLKRFSDFMEKHMPGEDDELTQRGEEYDQLRVQCGPANRRSRPCRRAHASRGKRW